MQFYERPKLHMHPEDASNFLKLMSALKIILGRSIKTEDPERAARLLKEYLGGYLVVSF